MILAQALGFGAARVRLAALTALLASSAGADVLYGVRANQLLRVDTTTGVVATLGAIGTSPVDGVAFGNDGTLYGMSRGATCPAFGVRELLELDTTTGAGTVLASHQWDESCQRGAAFDALWNRVVYVRQTSTSFPMLYHAWIQPLSSGSFLALLTNTNGQGFDGTLAGLEYDENGTLYGIDLAPGHLELVTIQTTSGVVTPVGSHGLAAYPGAGGLTIGPNGTLWTVETLASGYRLLALDRVTGVASVGPTLVGLAPGAPIEELASYSLPKPRVYGASKTHSGGCAGEMGSTGVASASAGSGFDVRATNMLNSKYGMAFYGLNGPTLIQAPAGTLNVNPPFSRTPPHNAGGNLPPVLDCSGVLHFDFNSYVASGADPTLRAGTSVWIQCWQRDPGSPPASSVLTNALFFTIGP